MIAQNKQTKMFANRKQQQLPPATDHLLEGGEFASSYQKAFESLDYVSHAKDLLMFSQLQNSNHPNHVCSHSNGGGGGNGGLFRNKTTLGFSRTKTNNKSPSRSVELPG